MNWKSDCSDSYNSRAIYWFVLLVLVLIPFVLYARTFAFDFVDFDDFQYIIFNEHVSSGLSLENIAWAFRSIYASNWHPLTWISHMLDVQFFGANAGRHHLTNVLFHSTNTLLLFLVLRQLTGAFWRCFVVATFFAVHPLHVESVAFIAERKDLLSTSFWMLTMLAYTSYVRRGGKGRYLLVLLLYTAGLMAKPMLVTLPLVLLIIDYWPLGRLQRVLDAKYLFLFWEKLPLFILSALSCIVTVVAQHRGESLAPLTSNSILGNTGNALVGYVHYLWKMVWPVKLAAFYPMPNHLAWWEIAGSASILFFITIVVVRMFQSHPYLITGWFWYIISLLPVIGIIQVGIQASADRYTYIPLIGIFILLVWGMEDISKRWAFRSALLTVIGSTTIVTLAAATWFQEGYWKNGVALFEHTLQVTSDNPFARHNLGVALMNRGRYLEAIGHFREVLLLAPDYKMAYLNMGHVYMKMGDPIHAIESYQNAIDIDPGFLKARRGLAKAYSQSGQSELAEAVLSK